MKALLMQKKVWAIVSGLDVRPATDDPNFRDWIKDQQSAAGIIFLGLEDDQKHQIEDVLDDPSAMWIKLEAIHVQKRPSTRFNAYNSPPSITKLPDESLPSLTSRIEKAMQEVKNLRSKAFSIDSLDNDLLCMAMVRSLPSEYRSFVSSITLLKQQGDLGTQWGFKIFYNTTEGCTYLGTQWGFKIGTLRVSPSRLYGLWYKQDNTGSRARQSLASGQPHYK